MHFIKCSKSAHIYVQVTRLYSGHRNYDRCKGGSRDVITGQQSPCREKTVVNRWVNKTSDQDHIVHSLWARTQGMYSNPNTLCGKARLMRWKQILFYPELLVIVRRGRDRLHQVSAKQAVGWQLTIPSDHSGKLSHRGGGGFMTNETKAWCGSWISFKPPQPIHQNEA